VEGEVTVERGEGWTLYLGDCIEVMAGLEKVDHILCDPPYEAEAHTKARRSLKDATRKRGARNRGEVRRIDGPIEIDFVRIDEATRTAAGLAFAGLASRWTIAFCQAEAVAAWRYAFTAAGLDWVRAGIWRKPDGAPQFTGDRPGMGYESLAIAHQPGKKRWNGGGKHGVWTVPLEHERGVASAGKGEHPTTKPVDLMLALVADFTDPGETILDPFAGSGTTGVACLRLGRRFIGIEKDPKYFALAVERLRAEESGSTLQARRAGQTSLLDRLRSGT
jgi:site-specific DNA-methyltransferase (adenine-specific)